MKTPQTTLGQIWAEEYRRKKEVEALKKENAESWRTNFGFGFNHDSREIVKIGILHCATV